MANPFLSIDRRTQSTELFVNVDLLDSTLNDGARQKRRRCRATANDNDEWRRTEHSRRRVALERRESLLQFECHDEQRWRWHSVRRVRKTCTSAVVRIDRWDLSLLTNEHVASKTSAIHEVLPSGMPLKPEMRSRRSRTRTAPIFVRGSLDFFAERNRRARISPITFILVLTCEIDLEHEEFIPVRRLVIVERNALGQGKSSFAVRVAIHFRSSTQSVSEIAIAIYRCLIYTQRDEYVTIVKNKESFLLLCLSSPSHTFLTCPTDEKEGKKNIRTSNSIIREIVNFISGHWGRWANWVRLDEHAISLCICIRNGHGGTGILS